jgi:diacylglycerol O-acyltransferase
VSSREPKDPADTGSSLDYDDWMSDSDSLMWHIERDPLLRSTVLTVWVLDQPPDLELFRNALERTQRRVPRLRQRVVEDPLGVSPPRWVEDPLFDPDYHVRRIRAPGEGTLRDLLDLAAPVMMQAFDKDRPLWEMHGVEGLEGGKYGILMKVHHAMTDGVGMVRMTEGLVERSREAGREAFERQRARDRSKAADPSGERWEGGSPATAGALPSATARWAAAAASAASAEEEAAGAGRGPGERELFRLSDAVLHRASTTLGRGRRVAGAVRRGLTNLAGHPLSTTEDIFQTLESVGRLVRPVSEPMSPLWRERSLGCRLHVLELQLEDLKRAARAGGGTLNDVFVAAVAGGLALHHSDHGGRAEALRMSMPINMRGGEKAHQAGNQFVPARFEVPLDITDPCERIRAVHELVRKQRGEPALVLMEEVAAAINLLGESAATRMTGSMMKAIDFVTSNVPGPPFTVFTSGARIERMYPFGPLAGAAANITLFSYDGVAHVGINADSAAVSDSAGLQRRLEDGFAEMLALG